MPHTKDFLGRKGYKEPKRLEEKHRPTGHSQPREGNIIAGTNKAVKEKMKKKIGESEGD